MRLIGINGRKGSGKDTVFDIIRNTDSDATAVRRAFGDDVKVLLARTWGFRGSYQDALDYMNEVKLHGHVTVNRNADTSLLFPGRETIQNFGHTMREEAGEDFWVNRLLPFGEYPVSPHYPLWWDNFETDSEVHYAVVTDVRYENEAARVLNLGGEIWQLDAEVRLGPNKDKHASEQPLPPEYVTVKLDANAYDVDAITYQVKELVHA